MAISAETLNVILKAKDKDFARQMERNEKRVQRFSNKSNKNLKGTTAHFDKLSKAIGGLGIVLSTGAIVAGAARMIDNATKMAKEIDNLSRLSGVGVERFQELAFASRTVGIEQEKLADILKDVNDKFGDYAATGGGPLADFFDNIAPKVGITQKAFEGLSSDKALGLYIKTLQQAGVNQQEMTFYMEALASDATALTPLFYNNAAAMDELATSAHDLGVVMDQSLIQGAVEMRDRWDQVLSVMGAKFNRFALGVVNGFDMLFNISEQEQLFEVGEQINDAMERRMELSDRMRKQSEGNTGMQLGGSPVVDNTTATNMQEVEAELNALYTKQQALNDLIETRTGMQERLNDLMTDPTSSGSGAGTGPTPQDRVAAEQELVRLRGMSAEAIERERIELEKQSIIQQAIAKNVGSGLTFEAVAARIEAERLGEEYEAAAIAASKILNPIEGVAAASSVAASSLEQVVGFVADASPLLTKLGVDAAQFESIMDTVESSMESAFMSMVDGTASASDAFKAMARDIVLELYRILVVKQATGFITDFIGGLAGGAGGAPTKSLRPKARPFGRASGGTAMAGKTGASYQPRKPRRLSAAAAAGAA